MTVILAEQVGKRFILGRQKGPQPTFREALVAKASGLRDLATRSREYDEAEARREFWALRDVSFSVQAGDVVGIIGRNGAGKSTLLKLLARITPPSEGRISIRGRIASLLEVGTGFHPELTGRENVFLNGAVLGMTKAEIRAKFDEIVAFAEVEEFLDTPVKRYSSGMYVRLAFAVAAHLEPEILVVDEVLAVGDAQFQKKCLGKMGEVASREGRTVLFVSHNMGAVQSLCRRGIVLNRGRVVCDDTAQKAIGVYSAIGREQSGAEFETARIESLPAQVLRAWVEDEKGERVAEAEMGNSVFLVAEYVLNRDVRGLVMAMLLTKDDVPLLYSYDSDKEDSLRAERKAGIYQARIAVPAAMLKEGSYSFALMIGHGQDNITDPNAVVMLNIVNTSRDLTHRSYKAERLGFLALDLDWNVSPSDSVASQ